MAGNNQDWSLSQAAAVSRNSAQGWTMEMVKVRVRNQHHIDARKVSNSKTRSTKAPQHEEPSGKVRINDKVLTTNLQEEAGMTDESDSGLTGAGQYGDSCLSRSWRQRRMPNELGKLSRFFS